MVAQGYQSIMLLWNMCLLDHPRQRERLDIGGEHDLDQNVLEFASRTLTYI